MYSLIEGRDCSQMVAWQGMEKSSLENTLIHTCVYWLSAIKCLIWSLRWFFEQEDVLLYLRRLPSLHQLTFLFYTHVEAIAAEERPPCLSSHLSFTTDSFDRLTCWWVYCPRSLTRCSLISSPFPRGEWLAISFPVYWPLNQSDYTSISMQHTVSTSKYFDTNIKDFRNVATWHGRKTVKKTCQSKWLGCY